MKKAMAASVLVLGMALVAGCDSPGGSALLGGVGGAAAGAGGYEIHLNRQKDRIEQDRQAGRITQEEYRIRLDQIQRDSLIQ